MAPTGAVRRVRSRAAEVVSRTPIRIRNQTGKCHNTKALAHPLVSENLFGPCWAKMYTRNRVGSHNARSPHGIFFRFIAPPERGPFKEPSRRENFPAVVATRAIRGTLSK